MPNLGDVAPNGPDWLARRVKKLEERIRALETAQPQALSSSNFDGEIDPPAVGSHGWALTRAGDLIISGSLYLGDDLIGDEALQNPVRGKVAHADNVNFAVTMDDDVKASALITVPDGFTSALVLASAALNARNTRAVQDWIGGYAEIEGDASHFFTVADGAPGYTASFAATHTALLTGLDVSGDFHVRAHMLSGGGTWAADSFNGATIDALVLFLR